MQKRNYNITGPSGTECMNYEMIQARSPLGALFVLHTEALGPGRVRIDGDHLVFSSPEEQEICAGIWSVVECRYNGRSSVEIAIPAPRDTSKNRASSERENRISVRTAPGRMGGAGSIGGGRSSLGTAGFSGRRRGGREPDQAAHVGDQVGEAEPCGGSGQADRADHQAKPALLGG
jgi:hypothetical protein